MTETIQSAKECGLPIVFEVCERDAYKGLFSYETVLDRLPADRFPSAAKAEFEMVRLAEVIAEGITNAEKEAA